MRREVRVESFVEQELKQAKRGIGNFKNNKKGGQTR
jgi:hypothetical protein